MKRGDQNITLISPGKGKSLWGDPVTCKAVSEDALGAYSLFEVSVAPQGSLPSYMHQWERQAYYIVEGELLIQEGDRTFVATAGSFVDIPRDILHTFTNLGTTPARLLAIITPAWYGKFFEEWASQRRTTPHHRLRLVRRPGKN